MDTMDEILLFATKPVAALFPVPEVWIVGQSMFTFYILQTVPFVCWFVEEKNILKLLLILVLKEKLYFEVKINVIGNIKILNYSYILKNNF